MITGSGIIIVEKGKVNDTRTQTGVSFQTIIDTLRAPNSHSNIEGMKLENIKRIEIDPNYGLIFVLK